MDVRKATYSDCKPFIPAIRSGRVVKVYDGDTLTIAVSMFGTLYRFNLRLRGIDCPEIRSKKDSERQAACKVQAHAYDLLFHKMIDIEDVGYDKYGRLLANVYVGKKEKRVNVSQYLLDSHMAIAYTGKGRKMHPNNWLVYMSNVHPVKQYGLMKRITLFVKRI